MIYIFSSFSLLSSATYIHLIVSIMEILLNTRKFEQRLLVQ